MKNIMLSGNLPFAKWSSISRGSQGLGNLLGSVLVSAPACQPEQDEQDN